jgi:hypothetical protein
MPWFSAARPAARSGARALATACAALAAGAATAAAARAQPATLTFDALTAVDGSGIRFVDNCYTESGFRVRLTGLACGAPAALATWTPDNDLYYTGSPALYNNFEGSVDVTAVGGRPFTFHSIGLAPFLGQLGNPTTVLLTGVRAGGGGMVTQSLDVAEGTFGVPTTPTLYNLVGFDNLSALRLTVTSPAAEPFVQFDDVTLTATPEPGTVLLLGGGLLALGAVARRRALRVARAR